MKKRTTILSLAFFAILMLVKISSFHAYTHDDCNENSIEDCSLCELSVENQQEFYFVTENYNLELFIPNTIAQQQSCYKSISIGTPIHYISFGRPPPSIG